MMHSRSHIALLASEKDEAVSKEYIMESAVPSVSPDLNEHLKARLHRLLRKTPLKDTLFRPLAPLKNETHHLDSASFSQLYTALLCSDVSKFPCREFVFHSLVSYHSGVGVGSKWHSWSFTLPALARRNFQLNT